MLQRLNIQNKLIRRLITSLLLLILISCKNNPTNFVGKFFFIDKSEIEGLYKSKNLDALFTLKDYSYFEPDYVGTSFETYYVIDIVAQNELNHKIHYLLFFDNNHVLCDTIKIPWGEIYSLNVEFENRIKGIAIGIFHKNDTHFEIKEVYEMNNNFRLKKLSNNVNIIKCPLPTELLSEENVGIEEYFKYNIVEP